MTQKEPIPQRHRFGRALDRFLTPALSLLGRVLRRPSDDSLSEVSGRLRGGEDHLTSAQPLEAGRSALRDGHYAEALVQFGLSIERDPENVWAWHGRGDAFQLAQQSESALEAYDEAVRLADDSPLSHCGRGNALESLGRLEEARQAWSKALSLEADLDWAEQGLARLAQTRPDAQSESD